MKQTVSKVVAIALALLLVVGMASVATAAQLLYVTQGVNVYTGPSTSGYATLGWLDKGDSVQATGRVVDGWTQIQYSTYEIGYVKNAYLSTSAPGNSYGYSYNYYCAPVYNTNGKVTAKVCADCGALYKTTSKLNIRSGPGTGYSVIGVLSKGQQVTRMGQNGKWFKILTNEGVDAYVSSSYLRATSATAPATTVCNTPVYSYEPGRTYYNYPCTVSTSSLYASTALRVRSGPGTNYSIIGGLQRGERVTYRGASGSWYQITTSGGLTGYAHSKYLSGSAPTVRYSSTPIRSYNNYNNCSSCNNYYYGSTCNSCYGSVYNGSVYSPRCSTPVFSSGKTVPAAGSAVTKVAITVTLTTRVASPSSACPSSKTLPAGTTVTYYATGTVDNYVCTIYFVDGCGTWSATNVPKASLGL